MELTPLSSAGLIIHSRSLLLAHHGNKAVKEIHGVMGARCEFGMVLDGEGRIFCVLHALQTVVIEVDMGNLNLIFWEAAFVYTKAMVLCSYLHMAGSEIFYRLVAAAVAEFQLVG